MLTENNIGSLYTLPDTVQNTTFDSLKRFGNGFLYMTFGIDYINSNKPDVSFAQRSMDYSNSLYGQVDSAYLFGDNFEVIKRQREPVHLRLTYTRRHQDQKRIITHDNQTA